MYRKLLRKIRARRRYEDINPEDIFLDSTNLPGFEEHALEGRIERPMSLETFSFFKIALALIAIALVSRLWFLSIEKGAVYAQISDNNRLEQTFIFANRGAILDRNGVELATNSIKEGGSDFAGRLYAPIEGLAHAIGYVRYPLIDSSGVYYERDYRARDGVERAYDEILKGKNGLKLTEIDVEGVVTSESVVYNPVDGQTLEISLDAKVTEALYKAIKGLANRSNFVGGTGVIIDVHTGEIIALTSFPEYNQNAITAGMDQKSFNSLINNPAKPFLNRSVGGLYAPGSILKPIVALAALKENIISPYKEITSTGSITVPNPYDPEKPSIFKDWKAHGPTDMRAALAVSSDTYFYSIGGGFGGQKGLGITLLDKYFQSFAIDEITGIELSGEVGGVIATPEWKAEHFNGDIWRLGDTYITTIGQFGTQITPLGAARYVAAIANKGKILKPSFTKGGLPNPVISSVSFDEEDWKVVHEGMRQSVSYGTSVGLNVPYVKAAAKTGTAEIGSGKSYVHSWSTGFFPYESPRYAWALVMEKGPAANLFGATGVMRELFDWMSIYAPEYFQ